MFKKVSPNCRLSCAGESMISRVIDTSSEYNSTQLVRDSENFFKKDFPDPSELTLQKQIDAGVPLKQVNTAVFDSTELTDELITTIESKITEKQVDNIND